MSHFRTGLFFSLILLLTVVSCTTASPTASPTTTQTAIPSNTPTQAQLPTTELTTPPTQLPAETPTGKPEEINLYLPVGIGTYSSNREAVAYYDLQGQLLGELQTTGLGTGIYQLAVIAGAFSNLPDLNLPPVIYYSFQNGGELWINNNNNSSLLRSYPNLFSMVGAPGKSFVTFTTLEYLDIGLKSRVYVSNLQTIATDEPILESTNTESYAIKPLAITVNEDLPVGIWYTTVPYGIGGNIVFEPRKTLNYLDLSTYQISSYLNLTQAPVGLSEDQTWVAYNSAGGTGPLTLIHNFDDASIISMPLNPDSDRGSGEAVFSPDNQYVAWKEASDVNMGENALARQMIRIASVNGSILAEIPDTSLADISGFSEIGWITPIGWLDTQTLAINVLNSSGDDSSVLTVKIDGTSLSYLAPGSFVGFLYP
jgi:hypothetical protein